MFDWVEMTFWQENTNIQRRQSNALDSDLFEWHREEPDSEENIAKNCGKLKQGVRSQIENLET